MKNKVIKRIITLLIIAILLFFIISIIMRCSKFVNEEFDILIEQEIEEQKLTNEYIEYITSNEYSEENYIAQINSLKRISLIWSLLCLSVEIIIKYKYLGFILLILITIRLTIRKYTKDKYDETDFKKDYTYYRDILKEYSAGVLSYIDDFNIDNSDIVSTVMALELKNKIKVEKNDIKIIDTNDSDLKLSEKYIFDCIKDKTLNKVNMVTFKNHIISECQKDHLIEYMNSAKKLKNNIERKKVIKIAFIILFAVWTPSFIFSFLSILMTGLQQIPVLYNILSVINIIFNFLDIIITLAIFIAVFIIFFIFFTPLRFLFITKEITYSVMIANDPYVRSNKAKDINSKLEGLKKYIRDFGLLEQKEKDELVLWEDYLIYSVMFGDNKKVVEDYLNIFNKL